MTTAATLQPTSTAPTTADAAIYIAPARFDVHATEALARWADQALANATRIVIDLRMVDFMDNQMIHQLDKLRESAAVRGARIELVNLSAAAALTFDLLQRVAA